MSVTTVKYVRKPFFVDAVQVTAENMQAVAEWCTGEVRSDFQDSGEPGTADVKYIHVRVHRPANDRQTKAYISNWILYAGTGYKVYTDKAFKSCFEPDQEKGKMAVPTAPTMRGTMEPVVDGLQNDVDAQKAKPVYANPPLNSELAV